jgi:hypothetical protein
MKYDLIIIYAGTGIPDGDLSPRVTGMGKKCPPQAFVGIPAGKFFRRGDGDGKPKPDGEFPVAISTPEPLSLSPSTQFFDFFLPTGIGLFPAPPRKSQPREGKEVGRKRTGKVEKSRPTWRARPCSFSPRPRHLVASLPPLVYSSSPVQTGASRAVLPLLLAQVQA